MSAEQYRVELFDHQVESLRDASTAIGGIAHIAHVMATDDEARPEWWSRYHDGVLLAALRCASNELDGIADKIDDQAGRQRQEAGRG